MTEKDMAQDVLWRSMCFYNCCSQLNATGMRKDRTDHSSLFPTALNFSGCRLPNCTILHHDASVQHWMHLATIAQRTLLVHLPLRSLVHCIHDEPRRHFDRSPSPDWHKITFAGTYLAPPFRPFVQPWPDLTTLHLDEAPIFDWPLIDLLPMTDWNFEVLILESSFDDQLRAFFFGLADDGSVKFKDTGWPCVRRIEIRTSREDEVQFRLHLAKWKAVWSLNALELRIFPLVVFLDSDGGGPDRRLVEREDVA